MKCREIAVGNDVFNKGVEVLIGSCGLVTMYSYRHWSLELNLE